MGHFSQAARYLWILLAVIPSFAQGTLTPIAGKAFVFPTTSVAALQAPLGALSSVAADSQGNVYAADTSNGVVVKITPDGVLSVVAGNASFIALDPAGNLYLSQAVGIGVLDSSGGIKTLVAAPPNPFAVDAQARVYLATGANTNNDVNCVILRYGPSGSTVVAGNGTCAAVGGDGSLATSVPLARPGGMAVDATGNLYFRDAVGVRKVDTNGILHTLTQGAIGPPLAVDASGNLYGPGLFHDLMRLTPAGVLSTIAGGRNPGFAGDGGPAAAALLYSPTQVAVDGAGNLYIADSLNYRVRRIRAASSIIDTVAGNGRYRSGGDGGAATDATIFGPGSMITDAQGGLLFSEPGSQRIRRIDAQGRVTTFLGGVAGFSGDGAAAAQATFINPTGLAFDRQGALYIADGGNNRVRRVGTDGTITTVAGGGTSLAAYDGGTGPATDAALFAPTLIAVDAQGNLFIVDSRAGYKVSPQGTISRVPALLGFCAGACISGGTSGISVDSAGALYVAYNAISARFACLGRITRYAPGGTSTDLATGICPQGLTLDTAGNLFSSSAGTVSRISPGGTVVPVASYNPVTGPAGGNPGTLALDSQGNLLVAESGKISRFSPCAITLASSTMSVPASAGTGGLTVTALSSCTWQAVSGANWIGLTLSAGTGAGSVYFSYAENTSSVPRTASIGVNGQAFTITQDGATSPSATAFEPSLQLPLKAGFYIAEATLAPGARGGAWGLEVLASLGQAAGGFNLGGGLQPGVPGFGAFLLSTPQTVTATLNGFVAPGALFSFQLMDADHKVIGTPVTGTPPLTFQQSLQPGFYIAAVSANGTVPANFLLGLSADFFAGGVDTGGYLGPGITGFGAFYVPEDQQVTIRFLGRNSYGAFGAESMILTLRDSNRNVLKIVSPP